MKTFCGRRSDPMASILKLSLFISICLLILFSSNINLVEAYQSSPKSDHTTISGDENGNRQNQALKINVFLPVIFNGDPPPTAFSKNAPANGAVGVNLTPILSWNPSVYAAGYEYCFDTSNDGACSEWISTGSNTYVGLRGLQSGTTYYWQVRAWGWNSSLTYANDTQTAFWQFTTAITTPGAFTKSAPTNGSTAVSLSPVLSWNASAYATKYEYCYDTTNDGMCSNWISTENKTYAGLWGLKGSNTYYWQVRSWNGTYGPTYANGNSTAYWYFSTVAQDPIQNGGFESGRVVWQEASSNGFELILSTSDDIPLSPHGGSWLAWLGGYPDEVSYISQRITIPAGRSILHFWVFTASSDSCGYDDFGVMVNNDVVYAQWVCYQNNTNAWVRKTVDLSAYVGQSVELAFIAELDAYGNSNVFLDDVSLDSTTTMNDSTSDDFGLGDLELNPSVDTTRERIKEIQYLETASPEIDTNKAETLDRKLRQIRDQLSLD